MGEGNWIGGNGTTQWGLLLEQGGVVRLSVGRGYLGNGPVPCWGCDRGQLAAGTMVGVSSRFWRAGRCGLFGVNPA